MSNETIVIKPLLQQLVNHKPLPIVLLEVQAKTNSTTHEKEAQVTIFCNESFS